MLCKRVFSVSVLKTGSLGQLTIYIGEQCSESIGVAPNFNLDFVEGIIRYTVFPPSLSPCIPVPRTRQIIVRAMS